MKLLTRQIGKYPTFGIDEAAHQCLNTIFMVNLKPDSPLSPYTLMAILNSTVVRTFWVERYWDRRRTFPKIKGTYLKELPIAVPSDGDEHRTSFEKLDELARRATSLAGEMDVAADLSRGRLLQRVEEEIDQIVCSLYSIDASLLPHLRELSQ